MKVSAWLIGGICLVMLGLFALPRGVGGPSRNSAEPEVGADHSSVSAEIASVSDAAFANRRWYVTDPKTARLHVLDSTGVLLRSVGRRGRGPGEFLTPATVAAADNRVYVAQLNVPDISVFDSVGTFLHLLHAEQACGASGIVALTVGGSELYVLRRCMELPRGYRLQVERAEGDRLVVWPAIADTIRFAKPGVIPFTVPVLAADSERILFANGSTPCLRVFRRSDGRQESVRCLSEIARVATTAAERASLQKSLRNRVELPDSLPWVNKVLLRDSSLIVQTFESGDLLTWIELPWTPAPSVAKRTLGRPRTRESYMSGLAQLIVTDDVEGMRLEMVRITH